MAQEPDYQADIVPRKNPKHLRIATFNVENLFDRAIALNYADNAVGQPYLDDYHELNTLFNKPQYSAQDKARILELMGKHKLTATRPQNRHLEFRKIRGQLFSRQGGKLQVVAKGRDDWLGWLELKETRVDDDAIHNTARVIAAVDPDILALVEVEHRPALVSFHDGVLEPILRKTGRTGYPYALVLDGNDARGIDVAILSRHPVTDITPHIFDVPGGRPIFSRDCCEYFVEVPGLAGRLVVMVNHFTSKGSDNSGMKRRFPQATQVAKIVKGRLEQGFKHFVVAGDLNDYPNARSLQPLLGMPELEDTIKKFAADIDPAGKRLGTYKTGTKQLDYLLMSQALAALAKTGGVERRGHYARRTWKAFETVRPRTQASDHHCVYVDIELPS
jgi:endonuclease/exonuclease/phosphatase family metal-dependent hydrolase